MPHRLAHPPAGNKGARERGRKERGARRERGAGTSGNRTHTPDGRIATTRAPPHRTKAPRDRQRRPTTNEVATRRTELPRGAASTPGSAAPHKSRAPVSMTHPTVARSFAPRFGPWRVSFAPRAQPGKNCPGGPRRHRFPVATVAGCVTGPEPPGSPVSYGASSTPPRVASVVGCVIDAADRDSVKADAAGVDAAPLGSHESREQGSQGARELGSEGARERGARRERGAGTSGNRSWTPDGRMATTREPPSPNEGAPRRTKAPRDGQSCHAVRHRHLGPPRRTNRGLPCR